MLRTGDIIAGAEREDGVRRRYTVDTLLGRGSSADVYRAFGPAGPVALKVLRADPVAADRARQRFAREFTLAAMLTHPHIVAMYEMGRLPTEAATPWMAMQYIDGPDSSALIPARNSTSDTAIALRTCSQIAAALDYAHSMDVLHRDVKPTNVLLTADLRDAYLSDFGIAQIIDEVSALPRNGRVSGSIAYAAPELLTGEQLSPATDLYAFSATVLEWLTGLPPYPRSTAFAITYAHLHDSPPRLSARRHWLPRSLDSVFAKALAKSPAARYESCAEFAAIVVRTLRDIPAGDVS
ncbi:serine/threonine-protein kinase [Mycolicibacterium sp. 22603]|uniref:serine/threonine-protein kinase n=1 Tax=Mycolicibacterium sp. 22603 TaxID=3453950 RepID=UPI003F869D94